MSDWSSDVCSSDLIDGAAPMADGDAVVFMNFRADRARQLSAAFVSPGFDGFSQTDDSVRRPKLAAYVCLTEYDAKLPAAVAFPPDDLRDTLGPLAAQAGLQQLRIAETEKYAHVPRSEEHTSELPSLMRLSYAAFCLKKIHN